VPFTEIPLHLRGGAVVPLRAESALTTTEVRTKPFHLIVAPDRDGKAKGTLYLDDGDSIEQPATSEIEFEYADGVLTVSGSFEYTAEDARVSAVKILGGEDGVKTIEGDWKLDGEFTVEC
jgi:alpha-glucosidase